MATVIHVRLLSFNIDNKSKFGIATANGVIDLTAVTTYQHLGDLLIDVESLSNFSSRDHDYTWEQIKFDIPIIDNRRLLCAGLNYHKKYPLGGEVKTPKQPVYFNKPPGTLVAHQDVLIRPTVSEQLDYEVELAIVIGKPGRHISESSALEHVAGYTILNDGSVRNWQRHSVAAGKNFYRSGSCGPWITTADELPPPADLRVISRVNGEERQNEQVSEMIFSVEEIISYLSMVMPLEPGDIIATGSPEGTGGSMDPQTWLSDGDQVEFEVPGIGILNNTVVSES